MPKTSLLSAATKRTPSTARLSRIAFSDFLRVFIRRCSGPSLTPVMLAVVFSAGIGVCRAEDANPLKTHPVSMIPAGVLVPSADAVASESDDVQPWNRLVLIATPKINSGDVDAMSASIRDAATACSLTLMASIKQVTGSDGGVQYTFRDLGVGYSLPINGRQTIISSDTAAQQGAALGFIARQILRSNEKRLSEVRVVASTSTLRILDAPSVVLIGQQHQHCITRHLIWLDPASGTGAMLVWLLQPGVESGANAGDRMIDKPMRLLRWGTTEQRMVHVDGSEFTLGFPSELAVALEDLPPGRDIAWPENAKSLTSRTTYGEADIEQLAAALNHAIGAAN
ncbi:hypothetical protein [Stieleria varia]|uniref:Uncharacterized protein n=1 Tax=Stieleria varia TaxID=2528005 RepID=A0A5C6A887_9BACT|nr:hypothetical protein [Stieleria varia]TWT94513.1 hypothetical protein Pla52n_53340 [Stieleria varia]